MESEDFNAEVQDTFNKAIIIITVVLGLLGVYAIYSVFTADISWGFKIDWNCFNSPLFPILAVLGFFLQFLNWQHFSIETWIGTKKPHESEDQRKWEKSNDITDVMFGSFLFPLIGHLFIAPCLIGAMLWYAIMGLVHILGKLSPFFISLLIIALVYFFFVMAMKYIGSKRRVLILSALSVMAVAILGSTIYLMHNPDVFASSEISRERQQPSAIGTCVITGSNINLREGPGTNYGKAGRTVSAGESFPVYEEYDGWAKIEYHGAYFWVSEQFCDITYDLGDEDDTGCWNGDDESEEPVASAPTEFLESDGAISGIELVGSQDNADKKDERQEKAPKANPDDGKKMDEPVTKPTADPGVTQIPETAANEPEKPKPEVDDRIYNTGTVQQPPQFPGGETAMYQWLSSHINYPAAAAEEGVQGRVTVQFMVDKDGSIKNVKVLRGKHPALDKEAQRVVSAMPKWAPGRNNGQPVKVTYVIPVTFKLQ